MLTDGQRMRENSDVLFLDHDRPMKKILTSLQSYWIIQETLRSFPSIALRIPTAHNFTRDYSGRALENGGFFFTTGPR